MGKEVLQHPLMTTICHMTSLNGMMSTTLRKPYTRKLILITLSHAGLDILEAVAPPKPRKVEKVWDRQKTDVTTVA